MCIRDRWTMERADLDAPHRFADALGNF